MNHHDTRIDSSSRRKNQRIPMLTAGMLVACILATAGAAATKTRFDLHRSRIFKQSRLVEQPPAVAAMTERWVGVVPPWHQDVIQVALPPVVVVVSDDETRPDKEVDPAILGRPILIIPAQPDNPQRSHDGNQEEPEITDHGGWEEVIHHPVNEETDLG